MKFKTFLLQSTRAPLNQPLSTILFNVLFHYLVMVPGAATPPQLAGDQMPEGETTHE